MMVVPVPFWLSTPAPLMMPLKVLVPASMALIVPALATLLPKVPLVARSMTRVAPPATVTALAAAMEPPTPLPICKVPALTLVAPV